MCGDFTFQHQSGLGYSIKRSTVPMMLQNSCLLCFSSYVNDLFNFVAQVMSQAKGRDLTVVCEESHGCSRNGWLRYRCYCILCGSPIVQFLSTVTDFI